MRGTKVLLVSLVACTLVPTTVSAQDLTAEEIKAQIIGHDISWRTANGKYHGKARYNSNGSAYLADTNIPKIPNDKGSWHFSGNKLCQKMRKARRGKVRCFNIIKQSDGTYRTSNKSKWVVE